MGQRSSRKKPGGIAAVVEMVRGLDEELQKRILENVAKRAPELALEIKKQLFTFADLTLLSDLEMQDLLKEIPRETLALAMRNTSNAVKDAIFRNISERAGRALREEIEGSRPRRLSEVREAQRGIVEKVKSTVRGNP